jgi:hypothetical protein
MIRLPPSIGLLAGLVASLPFAAGAHSEPEVGPLRFMVIVANNTTADGSAPELRYADDDAILYRNQLLPFFDRVELLTIADDETQSRNPGVGAYTRRPDRKNLLDALASVNAEIVERRPRPSELLFIYVGHGGLDEQARGFMHLADGRFTRADLFREVVAGSRADRTHIIVDACNAFSMIGGRGQGEEGPRPEEALRTFLAGNDLEAYPTVGALTATSESRETHEWSRLGAGVFSHQLRSALLGAADVNFDGLLEYSEVAAFVDAANSRLDGNRRVSVFAWPPRQDRHAPLLDIRRRQGIRHVVLEGALAGHFFLESERGDRWGDFNKAAGGRLALALPAGIRLFLRMGERETEVAPGTATRWLSEAPSGNSEVASRGAVSMAFERQMFAVPFGEAYYRGFIGGRPYLLPVAMGAEPYLVRERVERQGPGWRIEAGYLVAPLLLGGGIENGAFARGALPLAQRLWLTLEAEGGYSSLTANAAARGVSQIGLAVGLAWHQPLVRRLGLHAGVEVGDTLLAVAGGPPADYDWTVGTGRAYAGFELGLFGPLRLSLTASGAGYLVNFEGRQTALCRVEGRLGLAWESL